MSTLQLISKTDTPQNEKQAKKQLQILKQMFQLGTIMQAIAIKKATDWELYRYRGYDSNMDLIKAEFHVEPRSYRRYFRIAKAFEQFVHNTFANRIELCSDDFPHLTLLLALGTLKLELLAELEPENLAELARTGALQLPAGTVLNAEELGELTVKQIKNLLVLPEQESETAEPKAPETDKEKMQVSVAKMLKPLKKFTEAFTPYNLPIPKEEQEEMYRSIGKFIDVINKLQGLL